MSGKDRNGQQMSDEAEMEIELAKRNLICFDFSEEFTAANLSGDDSKT